MMMVVMVVMPAVMMMHRRSVCDRREGESSEKGEGEKTVHGDALLSKKAGMNRLPETVCAAV